MTEAELIAYLRARDIYGLDIDVHDADTEMRIGKEGRLHDAERDI